MDGSFNLVSFRLERQFSGLEHALFFWGKDMRLIPSIHSGSQPPLTLVPGDLITLSSTDIAHTCTHPQIDPHIRMVLLRKKILLKVH